MDRYLRCARCGLVSMEPGVIAAGGRCPGCLSPLRAPRWRAEAELEQLYELCPRCHLATTSLLLYATSEECPRCGADLAVHEGGELVPLDPHHIA